jgi:hypothetical protein
MRRTGRMLEPLGNPLLLHGPMIRMYARPDFLGLRHWRLDAADPKNSVLLAWAWRWQWQLLLHPLNPSHPFNILRS